MIKNPKILMFAFVLIFLITLTYAAPPTTTVTDYQRGVDIIHPETPIVQEGVDLEINFWTYNASNGATLTNTSLNCTTYIINDKGVQYFKFSNLPGSSGLMKYGKGSPLCVNCWTMTLPKANLSVGVYSYQMKCHGSNIGGYNTGTFEVTSTGDNYNQTQTGMILAQGILIALFVGLGFSFSKEKWKLRGFFFTLALFIGVIMINSIRVLSGSSQVLDTMTNTALIVGIVAVSFMAIYLLIYYTIELFKTLKNKKEMKWEVSNRFN
jgi:hypothetical protein